MYMLFFDGETVIVHVRTSGSESCCRELVDAVSPL